MTDEPDPSPEEPAARPSTAPLLSGRELFVQLVIIVLGVMIALSFEGLREWRSDRALVAEARGSIASEIRDNKAEIDGMPGGYAKFRAQLDAAADGARALLDGKPGPTSIQLDLPFAELGTASRATAELTGAFALMPYDEVRRYEGLYGLQRIFSDTERRCYEGLLPVISSIRLAAEPARATRADLLEWEREIHLVQTTLTVLEQIAQRLSVAYAEALQQQ